MQLILKLRLLLTSVTFFWSNLTGFCLLRISWLSKRLWQEMRAFCDRPLKPLTNNHYTIKDSFPFAKEVWEIRKNIFACLFSIHNTITSWIHKQVEYNTSLRNLMLKFYGKFWYKVTFHQHNSNRNIKTLRSKSL